MPDGERTNGTAATEHTAAGAEGKRREGRKGGRREGHGWPRAWRVEEGNEEEHGSRQGAERDQTDRGKKERYKYLRERREKKRRRDSQKRASVCIYISLNTVAWWLFIALSFIYIEGVYNIYLYIYIIPINVYFSFKANVLIIYSLLYMDR